MAKIAMDSSHPQIVPADLIIDYLDFNENIDISLVNVGVFQFLQLIFFEFSKLYPPLISARPVIRPAAESAWKN